MKNIHIENSCGIWKPSDICFSLMKECYEKFNSYKPERVLNRRYHSIYIGWWLRNIAYYITKPFCFIGDIGEINLKLRDIDLQG